MLPRLVFSAPVLRPQRPAPPFTDHHLHKNPGTACAACEELVRRTEQENAVMQLGMGRKCARRPNDRRVGHRLEHLGTNCGHNTISPENEETHQTANGPDIGKRMAKDCWRGIQRSVGSGMGQRT